MIDDVLDAIFETLGETVAGLVTPPGASVAIEATVVWLPASTEDVPYGSDFRRAEQRVLCLRRDQVPSAPDGTVIEVPDYTGGTARTWVVDQVSRSEPDLIRLIVSDITEET